MEQNSEQYMDMKKVDNELEEAMRRSLITHEDETIRRRNKMRPRQYNRGNMGIDKIRRRNKMRPHQYNRGNMGIDKIGRRNIEMDYDVNNSYEQEFYIIKKYNENKILIKKTTEGIVKSPSNSNILEVMFELVNEQAKLLIQLNKIRNKYQKKY
uniref:Uncharacterized protein n=1 Tax=Mimivirus LCMiAC02 TaxID=2506609 RepID=A0A4D5XFV1_9VIRU|nr:MAG: hypothetical protein LCMiAC02_03960 [Mimivirus LCMiAC02]